MKLEEEGLVTKTQDGRTAVDQITDAVVPRCAIGAEEDRRIHNGAVRLGAPHRRTGAPERARGDEDTRADPAAAQASPSREP